MAIVWIGRHPVGEFDRAFIVDPSPTAITGARIGHFITAEPGAIVKRIRIIRPIFGVIDKAKNKRVFRPRMNGGQIAAVFISVFVGVGPSDTLRNAEGAVEVAIAAGAE